MIELSFCQTYATQEFVRVSQHDFSKKKKPFHLDAMLVSDPGSVHLPRERWLGRESIEPFPFFSFGIDSGDGVSSPSFLLLRSSILSCFFGGVKFCAAMIRFSFLWGASVRPSVRPSVHPFHSRVYTVSDRAYPSAVTAESSMLPVGPVV